MDNVRDYTISSHAKQRYSERIMGKDDNNDIQRFITMNEEKIKTDINKMISYGEMIYSGKQLTKDGKGHVIQVYVNGCWVVLADDKRLNVITLYKVDLGCGDDFNKEYIQRMMDKVNSSKLNLTSVQLSNTSENEVYRDKIAENTAQILEYKGYIKNLEQLNESYRTIIENNVVNISRAEKEVAEVVNTLIGSKEF